MRRALPTARRRLVGPFIFFDHMGPAQLPVALVARAHGEGASRSIDDEHEERAIYVVEGTLRCEDQTFETGSLLVLQPGAEVSVLAATSTRLMLLGGAKLEGERHVWWNLVSSSRERIEQAKDDWKNQRFAKVPGETEFIPLP